MISSVNKNNSNLIHLLPPGENPPTDIYTLVEIPRGCTNKYEYHRKFATFFLDRVLYESVFFPAEYGVIPKTWADDDDPLDVMVLSTFPTFSGCVIRTRALGVLKVIDSGKKDDKIIGVPKDDPRFAQYQSLRSLTKHFKKEIWNFWENYAELQPNKKIIVSGWGSLKEAHLIIKKDIRRYQKKFKTNQRRSR